MDDFHSDCEEDEIFEMEEYDNPPASNEPQLQSSAYSPPSPVGFKQKSTDTCSFLPSSSSSSCSSSSACELLQLFPWVTKEVQKCFEAEKREENEVIKVLEFLTDVLSKSKATTLMGLREDLTKAVDIIKKLSQKSISLSTACDLFTCFVTRTSEEQDFEKLKANIVKRGNTFVTRSLDSRQRICVLSSQFIRDNFNVLVHGFSRVVAQVLEHAATQNKRFTVYVCESRPDNRGYKMAQRLHAKGIPVKLIVDAAVGRFMNEIDCVLVGAEGVVENGGIINKIGTYQVAITAKAFSVPVYAAAESHKFTRMYPIDQNDIPPRNLSVNFEGVKECETLEIECPARDYTPPSFLTLLLTDLGIFTPSAVSDELIKLYY